MRIKLFFFSVFFSVYCNAYVDYGSWGEVYDIKEKFEIKEDALKEILTPKKIKEAINDAQISKVSLPHCQNNKTYTKSFAKTLEEDIILKDYNISIKKGTKFNPLDYGTLNRYLVMIDASDQNQLTLAEHYKNRATIVIYNGHYDSVIKNIYTEAYIATQSFQDSFQINCLPTIYIQKGKEFIVKEINLESLINKQ